MGIREVGFKSGKGGGFENKTCGSNVHGETGEELLQLVVGGGVSEVSDVQPPTLSSRSGMSSNLSLGLLLGLRLGRDDSVLDSFGQSFHGVGSIGLSCRSCRSCSVLDSSSGGFDGGGDGGFGVGGHGI